MFILSKLFFFLVLIPCLKCQLLNCELVPKWTNEPCYIFEKNCAKVPMTNCPIIDFELGYPCFEKECYYINKVIKNLTFFACV